MAPLRLQRPGGPARDPGPPPPGALLRLLLLLRSRDLPAPVEDDFLFSLSGPACCWWHLLLGRDLGPARLAPAAVHVAELQLQPNPRLMFRHLLLVPLFRPRPPLRFLAGVEMEVAE